MGLVLRILKWLGLAVGGLLGVALVAAVVLGSTVRLPGEAVTPAGIARNTSHYVVMRDGVNIAVDVWLPADLAAGQKIPTLIRATRYGRAYDVGFAQRVLIALKLAKGDANYREDIRVLNEEGYAVVKVDARGSGASEGARPIEWSDDEAADYGEVAEWITQQAWSNGRIGAYGESYDGGTAEIIALPHHPAVIAVAPQYNYFDTYQNLIAPGGVFDEWFMTRWSRGTAMMDRNDRCTSGAFRCWWQSMLSSGVKPVNGDRARLAAIIAARNNPTVMDSLANVQFRDDPYGQTGRPFDAVSPFSRAEALSASGVAMNVWAGWYDSAAVDGALSRFATLSNPQLVLITPYTHGGKFDANPFAPADTPADPDRAGQTRMLARFFDPLLKGEAPASGVGREIRYYTLGENVWRSTQQWPPAGIGVQRWYFAEGNALSENAPAAAVGVDTYAVNFDVTTGNRSRWRTIGGPDVDYGDRREQDALLLTYTSAPLPRALEITGPPQLTIELASTHEDGAVHAYLEAVAPDGRVIYLTEGVLRLTNRAVAPAPYAVTGAYHPLTRTLSAPMTPGEVTSVVVPLYNISALVPAGYRLRVAIAGADKSAFVRIPATGDPVLSVHRSRASASFIELPRRWRDAP